MTSELRSRPRFFRGSVFVACFKDCVKEKKERQRLIMRVIAGARMESDSSRSFVRIGSTWHDLVGVALISEIILLTIKGKKEDSG